MSFKTPRFWFENHSLPATLLSPVAALYEYGAQHHARKYAQAYRSTLPVICVGNLVSGGAGKTPVVQAVLDLLHANNRYINPCVLLRGYGGKLKGPSLIAPGKHNAQEVGDEALVHAQNVQTILSRKRDLGAKLAEIGGNDIILMDDGLQNYDLHKDLSLLVFDSDQGLGNGQLFPAGPLREPLETALQKADAVIHIGNAPLPFETDKPVFTAQMTWDKAVAFDKPVFAFAGIGRPQKFYDTLKSAGADLIGTQDFADHHPYKEKDLEKLLTQAEAQDATLMTTAKDHVRLPGSYRDKVSVFPVKLAFHDAPGLLDFITATLHSEPR